MEFEILDAWSGLIFLEPVTLEYILLTLFGSVALLLLVRAREEFVEIARSRRRMALLIGLLIAPLITNRVLVLSFSPPGLLPPPNIPLEPQRPVAGLLSLFPVLAAGLWLGSGPALLVGLLSGLLRAGGMMGGITEPFHLAFLGFLAASCIRQDYRGRLENVVRQPVVASAGAALVGSFLLLLSVWVQVIQSGLTGLDYALQITTVRVGCLALEVMVAGVVFQVLYVVRPGIRPVQVARRISPMRLSLRRKLLVVVVPLIFSMTLILLYAVTTITLREARAQAVRDLGRDARRASVEIPGLIHTGQGLLAELVRDERLLQAHPNGLEELLGQNLRIGAFFDQLMLLTPEGGLVAMYPPAPTGDGELTIQEGALLERVLEDGAPQISSGHRSGRDEAVLSFLMPIEGSGASGARLGALIGRTHLHINPAIGQLVADLQATRGGGEGFVVDSAGQIVAHPDQSAVLTTWQRDVPRHCVEDAGWGGLICEGRDPLHNTRELLYVLPAQGYPWSVVIRLPYETVLEQARQVTLPLLVLQTLFGTGLLVATVLLVGRMTSPLQRLAGGAERIAAGTLTERIRVDGPDEVGRLGATLEDMRERLKERMCDLSLLLEVSQAVSSTLDLRTGMSFVLEGALQATHARVARAVFVGETRRPQMVVERGDPGEGLEEIDRVLVEAVEQKHGPFIAEDLSRLRLDANTRLAGVPVRAALALPIRTKDQMLAVIWLGYDSAHEFQKSKLDFLSMLTGQLAVLIENARLFQEVESERSRLAAILDSASDAVLVTDQDHRLLLVNPAAEQALGVRARSVLGRKLGETDVAPEVVDVAARAAAMGSAPEEVLLPDGRVLYASVSEIRNSEGKRAGRVAVMRDLTHFKKLDEMKSEFLATVSHDLRAPLTLMRGYANRLDAVGDLNQTQKAFVENILCGVERIDDLVTDLLDLNRIEAGLGVERGPCHLGLVLAEAVSSLRSRAAAKDITLQIEPPRDPGARRNNLIIEGDRALLRQAVINLLDNAIKYTLEGGTVSAELSAHTNNGTNRAVISIADTGIGIAPDEQARLFEKFYRTKGGGRAKAPGTGLGLAIVKSIVERHEGKVWVESRLDEGSTFHISLPLPASESVRSTLSAVPVA